MNWPFTRRVEAVVTHRLDAEQFAELKTLLAPPRPPDPPRRPPEPVDESRRRFVDALNDLALHEARHSHLVACWDIVAGRREPSGRWTVSAAREELRAESLPLPGA